MPVSCCTYDYCEGRRHKVVYRYPCEPECQRLWILPGMRHDWAPTEHATIIFSKNCLHITAVEVVVSVQLFPGLQLA